MTAREPNRLPGFRLHYSSSQWEPRRGAEEAGLAASLAEARGPPPASPPTPSLRRLSFPSEPCGRRSSSRGGAGAGWSEEPGSPSSRGVAWPPGGAGAGWRSGLGMGGGAGAGPGQQLGAVRHSGAPRLVGRGFRLGELGDRLGGGGAGWPAVAPSRPDERGV